MAARRRGGGSNAVYGDFNGENWFGVFPGNMLDHHTLKPAMEETVDTLAMGRYILVADWQVDELPKGYLRMLNVTGEDIKAVLNAFGIEIKPHIYTKGDIRELKSNVKAF